jgi:hypothetical protein
MSGRKAALAERLKAAENDNARLASELAAEKAARAELLRQTRGSAPNWRRSAPGPRPASPS